MIKQNFVKMLQDGIKKFWTLPAFSNYGEPALTYKDVAEKIMWFHYIFKKSHIKKGDKISLIGRNSTNWTIVYLATITYGAVIVPVLPDFHTDDFHHIIGHSDSVFVFVSDNIYEKLDEAKMEKVEGVFSLDNFKLLFSKKKALNKATKKSKEWIMEDFQGSINKDDINFGKIHNNDLAGILYTSGTSGFSKGVMLPHNSLAANVTFAQRSINLKAGDRLLSFLPLAHSFGCAFDFLFPFSIGCHITFLEKIPSPKILIQAFSEIRPRLILSVPLLIEKIYKMRIKPQLDKKTIKILSKLPGLGKKIQNKIRKKLVEVFGGNFIEIVIGGAALNNEVEDFLRKINFPFTVGYGMTECGPLISYTRWPENKFNSVGQLVDTLEIRIDSSVTEAQGGVGEILVRGENLMMGYYKNKEATQNTIDKEGWLHTGDLGTIDEDGFIYIKGRKKDIILGPSGENIYPQIIESKLNNLTFVEESLVIKKSTKLIALVYPNMNSVDEAKLNKSDLQAKMEENRKLLNEQLPKYSRISKIELYPEEFEKTPTKKIKRFLYTIPFENSSK